MFSDFHFLHEEIIPVLGGKRMNMNDFLNVNVKLSCCLLK